MSRDNPAQSPALSSALRLRLPRIEKRPKPVHITQFQDFASVGKSPAQRDELDDIVESIERGDGVPEAHYRVGIDTDRDGLLEEKGIMHLHLGGRHSDVLVFLIQYADKVVLLETNTHMHFRTQPAGKNILALNQSWLANMERDVTEAARATQTAATLEERQAAEGHRDRLAASIAAFKKKLARE